jgi:hypothetical protein
MTRSLQVLLRRDPIRDRQENGIALEGYQLLWPDGRPVRTGLNALWRHGKRLLGLHRHLADHKECRLELLWSPQHERQVPMTRLPGHRVRRFCLLRQGQQGHVHFLNGEPTFIVFDLNHEESAVLEWVGLPSMRDGEEQWFDLASRPMIPTPRSFPTPAGSFPACFTPPT